MNFNNHPILPSFAFALYRTNYLDSESIIPLISGQIYRDLSKAYHGGHTDVYRLYYNTDVHSYDYTSIYPTQMLNKNIPVGKIT